jgi:hypothetical protein
MTTAQPLAPIEVAFGDWILLLDGNVFELFHRRASANTRLHIDHMAVEAKPRDDGLRLTIGHEVDGMVVGQKVDVPADRRDAVMALFAEARRRRDSVVD